MMKRASVNGSTQVVTNGEIFGKKVCCQIRLKEFKVGFLKKKTEYLS